MSAWTHAVCDNCYREKFADRRRGKPVRVINCPAHRCCFCGGSTTSGIFVRLKPDAGLCHGDEKWHAPLEGG